MSTRTTQGARRPRKTTVTLTLGPATMHVIGELRRLRGRNSFEPCPTLTREVSLFAMLGLRQAVEEYHLKVPGNWANPLE